MAISLPTELTEAYKNGKLNLFIGSGVSAASKLVSWDDLILKMCDIIKRENTAYSKKDIEEFLKKGDHLDIAELFKDTVGERQYYRFLRELIRQDVSLSKIHKSIAKLQRVNTFFTTNYDKLLETTLRVGNKQDPLVVLHPEQLGFEEEHEKKIIKLHGDIDHPRTIILTRQDYAEYNSKHKDFELGLKDSIINSTLLFIGFGLRDQNFIRIFNDARSFYDCIKHKSFALMVGTNSVQRTMWGRENLKIIEVNNYDKISTVINQLSKY